MVSRTGGDEFTLGMLGFGRREPARHVVCKTLVAQAEAFFIVQPKF